MTSCYVFCVASLASVQHQGFSCVAEMTVAQVSNDSQPSVVLYLLVAADKLCTYGHSQLKTGHPVRSAIHKQLNGRLVLRWVTTWESLLLYVLSFVHTVLLLLPGLRSILILMHTGPITIFTRTPALTTSYHSTFYDKVRDG
jgi:hypothetical protein